MDLDALTTADGDRVYVDRTRGERGAEGPFYRRNRQSASGLAPEGECRHNITQN